MTSSSHPCILESTNVLQIASPHLFVCHVCQQDINNNNSTTIHVQTLYDPILQNQLIRLFHTDPCLTNHIYALYSNDINQRIHLPSSIIQATLLLLGGGISGDDEQQMKSSLLLSPDSKHLYKTNIIKAYRHCPDLTIHIVLSDASSSFLVFLPKEVCPYLKIKEEIWSLTFMKGLFQQVLIYDINLNPLLNEDKLQTEIKKRIQKVNKDNVDVYAYGSIIINTKTTKVYRLIIRIDVQAKHITLWYKRFYASFLQINGPSYHELSFYEAFESIAVPQEPASLALETLVPVTTFATIQHYPSQSTSENIEPIYLAELGQVDIKDSYSSKVKGPRDTKTLVLKEQWIKDRLKGEEWLSTMNTSILTTLKELSSDTILYGNPIPVNQWSEAALPNSTTTCQAYCINAQPIYDNGDESTYYYVSSSIDGTLLIFQRSQGLTSSQGGIDGMFIPVIANHQDPLFLAEMKAMNFNLVTNLFLKEIFTPSS